MKRSFKQYVDSLEFELNPRSTTFEEARTDYNENILEGILKGAAAPFIIPTTIRRACDFFKSEEKTRDDIDKFFVGALASIGSSYILYLPLLVRYPLETLVTFGLTNLASVCHENSRTLDWSDG